MHGAVLKRCTVIVTCCSGPVGSLLFDMIGPRWATTVAACVTAVGLLLSTFVTSFPLLCVTFGAMGGKLTMYLVYVERFTDVVLTDSPMALNIPEGHGGIGLPVLYFYFFTAVQLATAVGHLENISTSLIV